MQLRLGFDAPAAPVTVDMLLSGLTILVESPPDRLGDTRAAIAASGARVEPHVSGGLVVPVADIARLARLGEHVTVRVDALLSPLWELATHPPVDGLPATLDPAGDRDLVLRWRSADRGHLADIAAAAAPALLACELPFVAGPASWEHLRASSRLPVRAGVARLNLDGFIEIASSKPQLAEAAPLPGLFRLDDTHFGVAAAHYDAVRSAAGFTWTGPEPVAEPGPALLPPLPAALSAHALTDLRHFTDQLAAHRAAAVVWDPGLGRRIITLAALAALDAWPALVVTSPSHLWVWQRHAALVGRTASVHRDATDVRVVTYRDLARGAAFSDPAAVVFDDPFDDGAVDPLARRACHRLDAVRDAYRVAVCSQWPDDDPAAQVRLMALLRPREFRDDIDLAWRYPLRPRERAAEHVAAYLTRRRADDPGRDPTEFRRVTVRTVTLPADLAAAAAVLVDAAVDADDDPAALAELCDLVDVGTGSSTSPKLAAALEVVAAAAAAGRRVAVLTRSRRFASIFRVLAAAHRPKVVDATQSAVLLDPAEAPVVVAVFALHLPDVRSFDEVVVVDYPWSLDVLDNAVGAPSAQGPSCVTVVHAAGTVDDRVVVLGSLRSEGTLGGHFPTEDELDWLLSPPPA
jgi:hypothetical protein